MNTTNTNTNTNTFLPDMKKPLNIFPFLFLILFLTIILFLLLFKVNLLYSTKKIKSHEEIISNTFIVLFLTLLIMGFCIAVIPFFQNIKKTIETMNNVFYIILYTIFIVLFYTILPSNILNTYAYIISPITTFLGAYLFYKNFFTNDTNQLIILLLCLAIFFYINYSVDPGNFIKNNIEYSAIFTSLIGLFSLLYLIIVLSTNTFSNTFTKFPIIKIIGLLLFIGTLIVGISIYPNGFFNDKTTSSVSIILLLLILTLWSTMTFGSNGIVGDDSNTNLLKKSLFILFGIIFFSIFIFWLFTHISFLSDMLNIKKNLLYLLYFFIIVFICIIIFKTINIKLPFGNQEKNSFFHSIFTTMLSIPILLSKFNKELLAFIIVILIVLSLLFGYYKIKSLPNNINIQGGKQLVCNPIELASQHSLGTYETLNKSNIFDYQYAISCWFYLESSNSPYRKYSSLLNFGNKPNILYNGETNTLMVTIQQKDLQKTTQNKLIDFDENGNRILYKNDKILLQKWNNLIINYNGGILDIFMNGELMKSIIGVVPYYTLDSLTIGEENGLKGGICNVVYFSKSLNSSNIYYLYNMVKKNSPPLLIDCNKTIMVD